MWKEYLSDYIKNNRSVGFSVRLSAFISALLLSLLCGHFYNMWKYEVERIELEEGSWQSRITGGFDQEDLEVIRNFAHVKEAAVNGTESGSGEGAGNEDGEIVVDLWFDDLRAVFSDTPHIAEAVGVPEEKTAYHYELLAMYLLRDEKDTAPRMLFPLFLLVTSLASFSLIVIIHNAFAVSMHARLRQFGIFSSIGATPKQIRACLLQEAAALCAVPVLAGCLLGIGGSMGLTVLTNVLLGSGIPGRHEAVPGYHPLVLLLTLLITVLTVWISAWLPARSLSRLTPLEAIRNAGELQLKRKKHSYLLSLLFGVEGELAGNALKAQRKALRTASLSLVLSFLAFTVMRCFFTLSAISTRETYFERYQNVWDIMVTVKDAEADAFAEAEVEAVRELDGAESVIVYQKAMAKRIVGEAEMSGEMKANGGFTRAPGAYVAKMEEGWLVNAPLMILDDDSFAAYCEQIGIAPRLDGAVLLNRIRDVTNPDFRHPEFMPYLQAPGGGEDMTSVLRQAGREDMTAGIPVLACAEEEELPALREEYATLDHYELVHFLPVSLWRQIKGQIGGAEADCYLCVRGGEAVTPEELDALQEKIDGLLGQRYTVVSENRIRESETNDRQLMGMMAVLEGFCVLLAVIGIGNVFSNTLGFVRQRRREFARYLSVGLTPAGLRKVFCIEALAIAGRPVLVTLPIAAVTMWYMLKMSYVEAGEFLAEAPFAPILLFMLAIFGSVALAYWLAWRNVRGLRLVEVLRDDTML